MADCQPAAFDNDVGAGGPARLAGLDSGRLHGASAACSADRGHRAGGRCGCRADTTDRIRRAHRAPAVAASASTRMMKNTPTTTVRVVATPTLVASPLVRRPK